MTAAHDSKEWLASEVRKQAERRVANTRADVLAMSTEEISGLLYELEVHQEELTIQNEELRRLQLELESSHERLADLYDFAPVGYSTVDAYGSIINANLATAAMLGQERSKIIGTPLALYCDELSRTELHDHLEKVLASETSQSCELKFTTADRGTLDVRLHSNRFAASGTGDGWQCRVIMTDTSRERRAETALRESESSFRTIFEQAAVGVAQLDSASGTILKVNRRYCEMFGTSAKGLVGRTWMELTHPDDLANGLGHMEQLRAGDIREFSIEKRMKHRDGSFVCIKLTVSPIWQPGELPSTHIALVEDISARKQAEAERGRLLNILQRSLNEIYVFDSETLRFEYVNAGALKNLGYSLDAMRRMTPVDINSEYTETTFRDLLDPLQSKMRELVHFETLHQRADGSCYPVEVHLQLNRRENDEVFLAVILDITERKRQEQQFRTIVETTQEWIWEIDLQGVHTYSNPAIETLLGYSVDEIVGGNALDLLHEQDRKEVEGKLPRLAAQQQGWTCWLLRWRHKDGSIRQLESNANPILDWNGQLIGFRGADRDVTDRVTADRLLRESEERYRVLIENATEAIVVVDVDTGRFIDFNQKACDLFKVSAKQLRQLGPVETSPALQPSGESSESLVIEHVRQTLEADGSAHVFEWTHTNSDGELIPCEIRTVKMPDPSGRLLRAVAIDITARKIAEEALRESQERFRQLAENIHDVFWLHDLVANKVLYVSPRYETTWGRSTEALYADSIEWAKTIHPDDRDRVKKSFLEQAALDEWAEEYRVVRPDGTKRYILDRAFPIRDEAGTVIRLAGIAEDITDRKNAEVALRESEEKFRALTERSPAIVLIARLEQILYCNSMLSEVTGYSHEELLRTPLRDIIHPDFRESIADRQRRRLRGEDVPQRYNGKIVTSSGEDRWLDVSVQLIEFEGAPAALVTCVDITDRTLAEAALRQSEETLRELNASLETRVTERTAELTESNSELAAFAHSVSHDLRAPLRAMEGFATALAEDYGEQLDEDAREFIHHIIESAQRLDSLVNDLLAFSRLGRKELSLKAIGLDSIVAKARRQVSSEIAACHAKLDVTEQMPNVLGHEATLVQVVANLLSNALKFVAEGAQPEIRAWAERRDDGMIRLWVEDNGIGIEDSYRDRIFRVFERLHGIESYPGTGIGLAIVARACERLDGRCGVDSQRDHGSRFWVEFQAGDTKP